MALVSFVQRYDETDASHAELRTSDFDRLVQAWDREDAPSDPRLRMLDSNARAAIHAYFNSDVDAAAYQASRLWNLFRHDKLPHWVHQLVNLSRGE